MAQILREHVPFPGRGIKNLQNNDFCVPIWYFDLALTNDVVITSKSHGSYRLVPVKESDILIDQATLDARIRRGIEEYELEKVHRMEEGESVEGFLSRMINEESDV